jgi:hypothetical protein
MCCPGVRLVTALFVAVLLLALPAVPQTAPPQMQPSPSTESKSTASVATSQAATRMLTIEVVVKDRQGHHVSGLKASDFQIFEQTPSRGKEKREQKIAAFREVRMAELADQARSATKIPPGVYASPVVLQKDPVPPTILLVDGLNTFGAAGWGQSMSRSTTLLPCRQPRRRTMRSSLRWCVRFAGLRP